MPGGTPWGQAQLRIFDQKFLPALKITKLVFFLLTSYEVVPTTIDGRNPVFGHKLHRGTPYHGKWQGYHK
jgi:hypothetical protein